MKIETRSKYIHVRVRIEKKALLIRRGRQSYNWSSLCCVPHFFRFLFFFQCFPLKLKRRKMPKAFFFCYKLVFRFVICFFFLLSSEQMKMRTYKIHVRNFHSNIYVHICLLHATKKEIRNLEKSNIELKEY